MAALTTFLAAAAVGVGAYSAYGSYQAGKDQRAALEGQAAENRKIQSEQTAINYQKQAQEQRQMIREERVRRAQLLQMSENTGTTGGSGESGAISGMGTQLANNLGINQGLAEAGKRIGGYAQNAADFGFAAQSAAISAQNYNQLFGLSMSIFQGAGGFKSFSGTPALSKR